MKTASILFAGILLLSPNLGFSQDLSTLAKTDPLILHGNTGASFTFNTSNESIATPPPIEWNLYGNYTMRIYSVELPFSFVIDQSSQSYSHPFTQFGISPTYKWAKFHFGYSNIQLSPLNSGGHSFNGIGIELTPNKLRFSAFYGRLTMTGNEVTATGQYKTPKYSGIGYGVKLGIGTSDNYFDITYFHAQDNRSSSTINNTQKPLENVMIGTDFKVKILKVTSFTGNFAVSGSTKEQTVEKTDPKLSNKVPAWALESAFSIDLKNFMAVISYRKVQPDFKLWGDPYTFNDGQIISLINGFSLAKGKINVNTNITEQSNDKNIELAGELNVQARKDNKTISGNLNIYRLYDKNPLTRPANQNKNLSASLTYNWLITEKSINLSLMSSYNHFVQSGSSASSLGAILGVEGDLLKDKKMNLIGTIGYVYNNNHPGDSKGNITFSCKAGYKLGHNCSFSFFVNYMVTPVDRRYNITDNVAYKTTTNSLTAGISYTSSF